MTGDETFQEIPLSELEKQYRKEIGRLLNATPSPIEPIDYRLGIDEVKRQKPEIDSRLITGMLLEIEMIKLGLDPRKESDKQSFYNSRRKYECAQQDYLHRYGEAPTDIVVPIYEVDPETRKPKEGNLVQIWREKKLDSYVAPKT